MTLIARLTNIKTYIFLLTETMNKTINCILLLFFGKPNRMKRFQKRVDINVKILSFYAAHHIH